MKVDTNALKGEIMANGLNQATFAKKINVNATTLNRYLNSERAKIPICIAHKMVEVLNLPLARATSIFFNQ